MEAVATRPGTTAATRALWLLRGAWVAVLVMAPALTGALEDTSSPVRLTVAVTAWMAWGAVLVGMLVPSVVSLTLVRLVVPAAPLVAAAAWIAGADPLLAAVAMAIGLATALLAMSGEIGEAFAQASAYGDETRLPLRIPAALLLPTVLTWLVLVGSLGTTLVALAARAWAVGLPAAVLAAAGLWVLPRRFLALASRWLVYVPAGIVLHDPVVLAESVAVRRTALRSLSLALAGTDAADLTGPAAGHAVEIRLVGATTVVLAPTPAQRRGRPLEMSAMLVAPTRPGRALAEAQRRGLRG